MFPILQKRKFKCFDELIIYFELILIILSITFRDNENGVQGKVVKISGQKVIDSGAGFLIEEDDDLEAAMVSYIVTIGDIKVSKNEVLNFLIISVFIG